MVEHRLGAGSGGGWVRTPWVVPLAVIGLGAAFSVLAVLAGLGRLVPAGARLMPQLSQPAEQVTLLLLFAAGVLFCYGAAYAVFRLSDRALTGGVGRSSLWVRRLVAGAATAAAVGGLFIQLFESPAGLPAHAWLGAQGAGFAAVPFLLLAGLADVVDPARGRAAESPVVPPRGPSAPAGRPPGAAW